MTKLKIRDLRRKEKFQMDDDYLNSWAKYCGANATLVYISLCRHSNFYTQMAYPSQQLIADELDITIRRVRNGVKQLRAFNIIRAEQEKSKTGRFKNYIYYLLDKTEWKTSPYTKKPTTDKQTQKKPTVYQKTDYGKYPTNDNKGNKVTNITLSKDNVLQEIPAEIKREAYLKKIEKKQSSISRSKVINKLTSLLKKEMKLDKLDDSAEWNRKHCNNAIKKFGVEGVTEIILIASKDGFWRDKVTSFKTLYRNGVRILKIKENKPKIIDLTNID